MMRLYSLALLGLAMADTDPRDFARLCDSDARCPENWKLVDKNCVMFAGWEEVSARELCKQNEAEYREFVFESTLTLPASPGVSRSQHSLPVCLVRRETQCGCGKTFSAGKVVGGVRAEKNEFPWQGKFWIQYLYFHLIMFLSSTT